MSAWPLVKIWGQKEGKCNICGKQGSLTDDHTPPRSCIRPKTVKIRHAISMLGIEGGQDKGIISQNGLKYRTLCASCNSTYLGRRYDPALAEFTSNVVKILPSIKSKVGDVTIPGRPQLIMRAVWGHLAAQGINRYWKGTETEAFTAWFHNDYLPLPKSIQFYYWLFPYDDCIVFRDVAYLDISSSKTIVIWLMKFFPISFMISFDNGGQQKFDLPCLSDWQHSKANDRKEIPLPLSNIPHRKWPEAPVMQPAMVMYGQEAVYTLPHISNP